MKLQIVLLVLLVGCSLALLTYVQAKRKLEIQLNKTHYFEHVKHQVTNDVLVEFRGIFEDGSKQLESISVQLEKLKVEVQEVQKLSDQKKADTDSCNEELVRTSRAPHDRNRVTAALYRLMMSLCLFVYANDECNSICYNVCSLYIYNFKIQKCC